MKKGIDQKQTLERLQESLSLQQATIESTADGILVVNNDGHWSSFNKKFIEMWRITPEIMDSGDDKQALSHVLDQLSDPQSFIDKVMSLYSHPQDTSFDVLPFKDGRLFERYSMSQKIDHQTVGRVWSFRDVTDRHQVEEKLRLSEERFALAMAGANDGLWDWNLETDEVYYSPRWLEMLGYEADVFPQTINTWAQLVHADDKHWVLQRVTDYLQGDADSFEVEMRMHHRDGHDVIVLSRASKAVRQSDNKPIRLVGTHVDISERKQAEQKVLESERSYRGIFNSLNEAVYIQNENGLFLDVNDGVVRMYGLPRDHFIGHTPEFLAAPGRNDLESIAHLVDLAFKGEPQSFEFWAIHADGTEFPKEVHVYPGEYLGQKVIIAVASGISERKQAETALRESEERFQQAQAVGHVGVWDWNPLTGALVWTEETFKIFGYKQGEVEPSYELFLEHVHPDDREILNNAVESALHNGKKYDIDCRFSRKDESEGTAYAQGQVSYDTEGNPLRMLGTFQDISERKQQQALLEASQKKFSTLFESSTDGLFILNMQGNFIDINKTAHQRLGYSNDEMMAMKVTELDPPEFAAKVPERMAQIHKKSTITFESAHYRKDGSIMPVEISARILELAGEQVVFCVVRDISERKEFEEQLRQSQKMEAIGTLVGGIAHDFNNMLAAMLGNIYLAKLLLQEHPMATDKLANIEKLGNRAAEMVQQLLTFARKDSVAMHTFSLNSFMNEGYKLATAGIPENIDHQTSICKEKLSIKGDATQLQQVLMNLLNNAVDAVANTPHPKIHCTLTPFEADEPFRKKHPELSGNLFACISVHDNGRGIPGKQLDKIFEPFFTTKEVGKGTGLGLAMLYGAIQTHGGVVEVESNVDIGSLFRVYLPLNRDAPEVATETNETGSMGRGETILLVDDEDDVRSTTSEVLNMMGYHVVEASDGEEALDIFKTKQEHIDLIISDIIMPKMGGTALLKAVLQRDEKIPFILVSGYDKDNVIDKKSDFPVLNKPFDFDELSRLIQGLIHKRHDD